MQVLTFQADFYPDKYCNEKKDDPKRQFRSKVQPSFPPALAASFSRQLEKNDIIRLSIMKSEQNSEFGMNEQTNLFEL